MTVRTIWKFPLAITGAQTIRLPKGAQILTVQAQQGVMTLWAEVDPLAMLEERVFEVYGTGRPIDPLSSGQKRTYVATVQMPPYVWHVYAATEPSR